MENSGSQLETIKKLFKNKDVQILWSSCLEDYKLLIPLSEKWKIHRRLLYKHRRTMLKLNLIDEKKPSFSRRYGRKLPNFEIKSKVDWLSELAKYLVKKKIYYDELEKIFGSPNNAINNIVTVADSEAFRKGIMNLDFFMQAIKRYNEICMRASKFQIFYGHKLKKLEKEIFFPDWVELIINRLAYLSLFKAFQNDIRCLNLFKLPQGMFIRHQIFDETPGFSLSDMLSLYQQFLNHDYKIPEEIKPYFTFDDIVALIEGYFKRLKAACPEAWAVAIKKLDSY